MLKTYEFMFQGKKRSVGPVPVDVYADLRAIVSYIKLKRVSKLSSQRHEKLDAALKEHASVRDGVKGLAKMMDVWQQEAKDAFDARNHYTEKRASNYTKYNLVSQRGLTRSTVLGCGIPLSPAASKDCGQPHLLLDVGCGTGLSTHYAIQENRNLFAIGIDISRPMLEGWVESMPPSQVPSSSTTECISMNRVMDRVQCDFNQGLPFRGDCFDAVFGVASLHFLNASGKHCDASPEHRRSRFFSALSSTLKLPQPSSKMLDDTSFNHELALKRGKLQSESDVEVQKYSNVTNGSDVGCCFQVFPIAGEEVEEMNKMVYSTRNEESFQNTTFFGHWPHHTPNGIRWFLQLPPPSLSNAPSTSTNVACILLREGGFLNAPCALCTPTSQVFSCTAEGKEELEWLVSLHCKFARKLVRTLMWQESCCCDQGKKEANAIEKDMEGKNEAQCKSDPEGDKDEKEDELTKNQHQNNKTTTTAGRGEVVWKLKKKRKDKGNKPLSQWQIDLAHTIRSVLGDASSLQDFLELYYSQLHSMLHPPVH
eukprot:m.63036 g.63036  ORF g.63036 m.63036 type:complete len:538 (+) comp8054_c0_seq1:76-1689(+)